MRGPESDAWAEWHLLVTDLKYCRTRIEPWRAAVAENNETVATSLFRDIVVTLISCFDTSVQVSLDPVELYGGIEGGIEFFNWLKGLRDSWVAHRHGPARQCQVGCVVDKDGNILGGGFIESQWVFPREDGADDILAFIDVAGRAAEERAKNAEEAALGKFRSLPAYALKKLPTAKVTVPDPTDHRQGRRRFANRKRQRQSKSD